MSVEWQRNIFFEKGFGTLHFAEVARLCFLRNGETDLAKALHENGFDFSCCEFEFLPNVRLGYNWLKVNRSLPDWLKHLPKPIAIFSSYDIPARELCDCCLELGIDVPGEVSILGVNNDDVVCELGRPPISSIDIPGIQIGFQAANMLDELLQGKKLEAKSRFLPPLCIVERQSTNIVAIDDHEISAALAFIRKSFSKNIGVSDVAKYLGVSRRTLERNFQKKMDRTVLEEIRYVRVRKAKELLINTDASVEMISRKTGFSTPQRLAFVFRQMTGKSPTGFPQQHFVTTAIEKNLKPGIAYHLYRVACSSDYLLFFGNNDQLTQV